MLKKSITFILLLIFLLNIIACTNNKKINSNNYESNITVKNIFVGESDTWLVRYKVDGKFEQIYEGDTVHSNTSGSGIFSIEYKGIDEELNNINELAIKYGTKKSSRKGGIVRKNIFNSMLDYGILIDLEHNNKAIVTIEWTGVSSGCEVITLNPVYIN